MYLFLCLHLLIISDLLFSMLSDWIRTEFLYLDWIQENTDQKYRKIRTRKDSVFERFARSDIAVLDLVIIFIPFHYNSFNKHNFELAAEQRDSHAFPSHVFFKNFTKILNLSVPLKCRDSYFQYFWNYFTICINLKIKMNSVFLQNQLFPLREMFLSMYTCRC